jgi:hypothetical protein
VVVVVLAPQVVDVAGADQRPPSSRRSARSPRCLLLIGDPVLLHLEVDVLGAVDLQQLVGVRARLAGRSSSRRWQKREARQPVSAITPSEWRHLGEVDRRLAALQALQEARPRRA